MQHVANMTTRNLICSGHKVSDQHMTDADRTWAMQSNVIRQDNNGRWYHTGITERDRKCRRDYWNPDTGPWRKGVNY
jgi:hypothetical protein